MEEVPIHELSHLLEFTWEKALQFPIERVLYRVVKQSSKAMKRKDLSVRERWLGVRFQKEILQGLVPRLSIRYIDPVFGYGVFAEQDFSVGAYIGEYTGVIRKRRSRKDRTNDYCFAYTIGDWVYNPFIIDAKERGNYTRFLNHSEEPNVESLSVYAGGIMHIIFVALKPIRKGSQMCYHYGDIFWKKRRHSEKKPLIES